MGRFLKRLTWNPEPERAVLSGAGAQDADAAIVLFHDSLGYVQAEAGAKDALQRSRVHPLEGLEAIGEMLARQTRSGIGDRDSESVLVWLGEELDARLHGRARG